MINAKQYLIQHKWIEIKIKTTLEEIETLKELALSAKTINYDITSTSLSVPASPQFIKCLIKIEELKIELDNEIQALINLKKQIRIPFNPLKIKTNKLY